MSCEVERESDLDALRSMLPGEGDLVVHLRLGDIFELLTTDIWLNGFPPGSRYTDKINLQDYYSAALFMLRKEGRIASRVTLVASLEHRDLKLSPTRSIEFLSHVQQWFRERGFTVNFRLNHNADADIVFMSAAQLLLPSGLSSYMDLARNCQARLTLRRRSGGLALNPDSLCTIRGWAWHMCWPELCRWWRQTYMAITDF